MRDYRRLPDEAVPDESPELLAEIRHAVYKRELVLKLVEGLEGAPYLEASASLSENRERVGARIRELLDISLKEQVDWKNEWAALSSWRLALEEVGVLVFQASSIEIEEMRGFSLTERPFPIVVVNVRDLPRGRIFSLIHELTHVLLHDDGLCDLDYREPRSIGPQEVERFCNGVAAATLVPRDDLFEQPLVARKPNHTIWSWDELRQLSSRYEVSDQALLGRLRTLGKVDEGFYWRTMSTYQRRYKKSRSGSTGWQSPPDRAVNRAGQLYTQIVLDSYYNERITVADLSDYLEVKLKHIPTIEKLVREKSAAR